MTDRKLWLLAVCVVGLMLVAFGQKPIAKTEPSVTGRYQLINAQQEQDGKIVFVLDTQSGSVWKYQTALAPTDKHSSIPEAFISVGFGEPRIGVPDYGFKWSAKEDSER